MTKHIRIFLMVTFAIVLLTGTVAAYQDSAESKIVTISDDNKNDFLVSTKAETVEEFIEEQGIEIDEKYDKLLNNPKDKIATGDIIKIKRHIDITLKINSEDIDIKTNEGTVEDILDMYASKIGNEYKLVNCDKTSRLVKNMTIKVIIPEYDDVVTSKESIPFETVYVNNPEMTEGTKRVKKAGEEGIVEITKRQRYYDGKFDGVEELSREIIKVPTNRVVEIGGKSDELIAEDVEQTLTFVATTEDTSAKTKIASDQLDKKTTDNKSSNIKETSNQPKQIEAKQPETSGKSVVDGMVYTKAIKMNSTAYTPYDPGCSGITATGAAAKKGIAAVDTNVIPFGTKLYIPGYGTAVAADRGGDIKGNRIDLCYNTVAEAYNWGRKNVTVYILE